MRHSRAFLIFGATLVAAAAAASLAGCRPKPPSPPTTPELPPPAVSIAAPSTDAPRFTAVAAHAPSLASMSLAKHGGKLGVPADLRYQFETEPETGRPAILHLAAVPRVDAGAIEMVVKEVSGVLATTTPVRAQKLAAGAALRQELSVTRLDGAPAELRVVITMQLGEASAFGYFSVPFTAAPAAGKQLRSTLQ